MSQVNIKKISEITELDEIAHVWDDLLERCEDNRSIFLTYEWIRNWWRYFGDNSELNIVLVQRNNVTLGIFPLMKKKYHLGICKFKVMETIGASNANLVGFFSKENRDEVIEAFLTYLGEELEDNALILKLDLVPDDCAFLELLRTNIPHYSDKLAHNESTMTIAPYLPIRSTWDMYFSSLSTNRRKKIRTMFRDAEINQRIRYGQCQTEDLDWGLRALFDIHINRWRSVNIKSPFIRNEVREFYRDLAIALLQKDWMNLSYLTLDGQIVSIRFDYMYGDKYYASVIARDLLCTEPNIGHLHEAYLIKEAFETPLKEYDFLRGDEPYKFYWTDRYRKYQGILIIRNTSLSYLRFWYIRICLRIIQFIQNKHDLKELVAIIKYHRKNRVLWKKMPLKL